ncbi:MAG: holo-ACP synthase [bacterium]
MRIETGVDIVSIDRIRDKFADDGHFMHLIFTDSEIRDINSKQSRFETIAGRWAGKEAFSKAMGTGMGKELNWKDIEIIPDINKKPVLHIDQTVKDNFSIDSVSLSISHTAENAVAVVVIVFT